MALRYHFAFHPDWRAAPLAYWVHVPVAGSLTEYVPAAPVQVPHQGVAFLHVEVGDVTLDFSALAQLDHFIDVMQRKPLPTSRQLSSLRGPDVGPNGHWLSRLPAKLKAPRERIKLVRALQAIREQVKAWDAMAPNDT